MRTHFKFISVFILLLLCGGSMYPQDFQLVLDKKGGKKRQRIHPGQRLHVVLTDGMKVKGRLEMVLENSFLLDGVYIQPNQVDYIQKDGLKNLTRSLQKNALIAIPTVLVMDLLGNLFNKNTTETVSEEALKLTAAFGVLGLPNFFIRARRIQLQKNRKLQILDLRPTNP